MFKEIYKHIVYSILLGAFVFLQFKLKETPQIIVISIAAVMLVLDYFKWERLFRIAAFFLLMIFSYAAFFQLTMFLLDLANPNRGMIQVNGEMVHLGMDMTAFFMGVLSFIFALVFALVQTSLDKKRSFLPDKHLAIATLIACSFIFVVTELL